MNVIQEIQRINKTELETGLTNTPGSWHAKYSNSAWVYVGNLPTQLTEGDTVCIMSQWGEIEDINLVREEGTGKSRGFCFVKYEDCRSCVLAVDNFNGSQVLGRSLRVDHVENYRLPKHLREKEEGEGDDGEGEGVNKRIDEDGDLKSGHAYEGKELANSFDINQGHDLFAPVQDDANNAQNNPSAAHNANEAHFSKEERLEAKLKRKAERDEIRREREAQREEKEERRRKKRAGKLVDKDDGPEGKDKRERKHERKHKLESKNGHEEDRHRNSKRRKHKKRDEQSSSRSRSKSRTVPEK